jgi:hypothetical protein
VAAGTRSVTALTQVAYALKMFLTPVAVNIPFVNNFLKDGQIQPNEVMTAAVPAMLDELTKLATALKPLRS